MLLQMDIEGYEYDAFDAMSEQFLSRFRIVIIELHSLYKFWEPEFYNRFVKLRDKLFSHHICVHLHPNNCCGIFTFKGVKIPRALEITLIKKDKVTLSTPAQQFPHNLDQDNTPLRSISLPEDWIGQ